MDREQRINWYPGHMAKTRRQLADQIRKIDLVIELCDARLPWSSRNPDLDSLCRNKRRILLMNKSDLAESGVNRQWLRFFREEGVDAWQTDATRMNRKETLKIIDQVTREMVEKALEKGVRKTVRAMIVGVPNVGKSTLINRLHGGSIARTGDRPGVTRSQQWVKITPYLELMDTPGLLWPRLDDQRAAMRLCYIGSTRDSVVDLYSLTISLLEELIGLIPERVAERFHIEDVSLTGVALLDAVCRGRGWLMKGNECDYDRCCSVVLDEFRGGKLGPVSLERPKKGAEQR